MWRLLPDAEKAPWNALAAADTVRFEKEKAAFLAGGGEMVSRRGGSKKKEEKKGKGTAKTKASVKASSTGDGKGKAKRDPTKPKTPHSVFELFYRAETAVCMYIRSTHVPSLIHPPTHPPLPHSQARPDEFKDAYAKDARATLKTEYAALAADKKKGR